MSSSETMTMGHHPSEAPVYGQGSPLEPEGREGCQSDRQASPDTIGPAPDGGCKGENPSFSTQAPGVAGQEVHPFYQNMYLGHPMPQPEGGEHSCSCEEQGQMAPMEAGPTASMGGFGPQPGMFAGGPQGQMFPHGTMPAGPSPQMGGAGPQTGMFPGGPQGQMYPHGSLPAGPSSQMGGIGPQPGMFPGGPQGQMPPFDPRRMGHSGCQGHPGMHPGAPSLKHDEHRNGQLFGLIQDLANGQPDAGKIMNWLESCDTPFWKGALVGVAATMLVTNPTVKKTIVDSLSGLWGVFQKSDTANTPAQGI